MSIQFCLLCLAKLFFCELHGTTEEGARVGRQLFHVEVHDIHLGRQPSGAADGPSGEAAAPGRSGGGRRGGCMEAAPGPPPQLSFPRRRGQRVGRGARTGAQETAARPGGGCRDLSSFDGSAARTSAQAAVGKPKADGPAIRPTQAENPSEEESSPPGAEPLWRSLRNSDPFRTSAAQRPSAPRARLVPPGGGSRSQPTVAAALQRVCCYAPENPEQRQPKSPFLF